MIDRQTHSTHAGKEKQPSKREDRQIIRKNSDGRCFTRNEKKSVNFRA